VPLQEYLYLNQAEQTGKVPFIWMIDEDNVIVRAAIPYMWVTSCLERLEFWNFVQELGGVNNYHVKVMLQEAKQLWEEEKRMEQEALITEHQAEVDRVRTESASVAMDRLASVLLDLEHMTSVPAQPQKEAKIVDNQEVTEDIPAEEAPEDTIEDEGPAEAYIETFKCTSCNDCTDMFPAIFSYNEEKQAYIKDASKGTFEHLVMAAESCPAACIHPGEPLDPNEPNLEELKERAAKFN
jgi:ferredoxin